MVTDEEVACFWDATFAPSEVNSCKPTKSKLVLLNSLRYEVKTQKFKKDVNLAKTPKRKKPTTTAIKTRSKMHYMVHFPSQMLR